MDKIIRVSNYIKASEYYEKQNDFDFSDKLYSKAIKLAFDFDPIRSQIIVDWMMRNQDVFGPPKEREYYDYNDKDENGVPIQKTKPSYTERDLTPKLLYTNLKHTGGFIEAVINLIPGVTVEQLKYLISYFKSGFFSDGVTIEAIQEAFNVPSKNNVPENDTSKAAEIAKSFYANHPIYRNIDFSVLKEIIEKYYSQDFTVALDTFLEKHIKNYLYYGDIWRYSLEHKINMPYHLDMDIGIDRYKEAYQYAINHENLWGVDDGGVIVDSFAKNITQADLNKSDEFKIAKAFIGFNFQNQDIESILNKFQNDIHKIYRAEPNTPEGDRLLLFFAKYPKTIGAPLAVINRINDLTLESSPTDADTRVYLPRLLNIFGKSFNDWIRKFDNNLHDAAQILPDGSPRELKGLSQLLLQYYGKYDNEKLTAIAKNWKSLTDEQKQLPIDQISRIIFEKNLNNILSSNEIKNIDFAIETAKWFEPPDEESGYDEYIDYSKLEEQYLNSQNVPLPKWAENNTVTIGNLTGRFLPRNDPRGMFLGMYSNCCQHPWGEGATSAQQGLTAGNAFFVVENNKTKDIVAQSWVWEDPNGNVVFDNVEANGIGPERMPIVQQIYKQVAENMKGRLVNMGSNMSDMDLKGLPKAKKSNLIIHPNEDVYTDSSKQVILSDNRTKLSSSKVINNYIKCANVLDKNSNYKLADYFNKEAVTLFKTALDVNEDGYGDLEIRSKTVIDWMLRNQRYFGPPHEKKIYSPIVKIGEPRDVIGTEPSYYEWKLNHILDPGGYYLDPAIENIINHYPDITPEEMSYMLRLKKSGYFQKNPINSRESIINALHALDKHGIENYKQESPQFATVAEILYTTNNLKFRDVPIEVLKEVYDQYLGMPINPYTIKVFEKHMENYVYYGSPWRNDKENSINIPHGIDSHKVDLYKNAYQFAKEHENEWGNDYSGRALTAFVNTRADLDQNKSDEWKIAKAFFHVNYSSFDIDKRLSELQNDIHRIYRFLPNTPENDKLLIFFSKYTGTLGIPLSTINSVEEKGKSPNPVGTEIGVDFPRILTVLGKNWEQWISKFNGDIHDAAQILPVYGNYRDLKDLGLFLLQYYGKYNTTTLTLISNGWKELTPEERRLPIDQLGKLIYKRKAKDLLESNEINNMEFAMEAAKWWEDDDNDNDDDDLSYEDLENMFIESQDIPLPEWTKNNTVTIGKLRGRFLPRNDPRGLFLGMYTNCCQHPWGEADSSAFYGQTSSKSAFFVIEDIKTNDIVAQSWVWEDQDGDVVFDNVEANGIGSARMPVVQQIYKQVAENMKGRLVHIGEVGDLDIDHLPKANAIQPPSGVYTDAKHQRILADNTGTVNT